MNSAPISAVIAWEALDSRGKPTVAVAIQLSDGVSAMATVPSGASAGSYEAVERRDGGARYGGNGVLGAVRTVHELLGPVLLGLDARTPAEVDAVLRASDPDPAFSMVGANAVLACSVAAWRVAAASAGVTLARFIAGDGPLLLPMPRVNVLSGGAHAGGVLDVQDFLVLPHGATTFAEAIEWCVAVRASARELALGRGLTMARLTADEGGMGIPLPTNRAALELLTDAIAGAGLRPGVDASIAVDVAATEFLERGHYRLGIEQRRLTSSELVDELVEWTHAFPIRSIEDPLGEDDWAGWEDATRRLGHLELVGDDLFVTNRDRLRTGIARECSNAVLVKPNQNGLVSGARDVVEQARAAGFATIASARSGETEDAWIADLAVGWRTGQLKVGSTMHGERTAKWNRLLELAATEDTTFAGPWPEQGN